MSLFHLYAEPSPQWVGQHEDEWDKLLARYTPEVLYVTGSAI